MPKSIVTIGNFDGVHAGHAALVRRARTLADKDGGRVVVLSFDPHPVSILRPDAAPERLSTFAQRERLLKACGADEVVRIAPTKDLLAQSAVEFAEWLASEHRPGVIVEGPDFRFGHKRLGDVELLARMGAQLGFRVEAVPPIEVELGDQTVVTASSSITRWLVRHGRVEDAARVLGRAYEIEGVVVRGERRGRTINMPTANIEAVHLAPADGVYAGLATLPDGRVFAAAISVGTKPTFTDATERVVEAHLLDCPRDGDCIEGLDEYGWTARLAYTRWLRDQAKYDSIGALLEQMNRDCERVRELADGKVAACR